MTENEIAVVIVIAVFGLLLFGGTNLGSWLKDTLSSCFNGKHEKNIPFVGAAGLSLWLVIPTGMWNRIGAALFGVAILNLLVLISNRRS